jgi:hypothetical protein
VARRSPELVGKLKKVVLIALVVPLLIAMVAQDPVGMWHFVVASFTLGVKLLNAVAVLLTSLISGTSH